MTNKSRITVFLIDDDASVRKALTRLIHANGLNVESFSSAEAFLCREKYDGVGCIVLDLAMPGVDGMMLQEELAKMNCELPIIFLTAQGDIATSVRAMKKGAVDFLTKPVDESLLLHSIESATARHLETRDTREKAEFVRECIAELTPREVEVMRCVIAGALNKQIAVHLDIAEKTVKVHRGRVMEKMGTDSVAELVRLCLLVGLEPIEINL
jgi:FixJ family two-component response regulator